MREKSKEVIGDRRKVVRKEEGEVRGGEGERGEEKRQKRKRNEISFNKIAKDERREKDMKR